MIANLRLQHFRSYDDASFEFMPGVNIVVGPNASGKTNLLEAVLVVAQGSSYRVKDIDLVTFDATWSRLDAQLTNNETRTIKITTEPTLSKQYEFAGKLFKRLTAAHSLPVVLFEPNHLQLLSGGPERRRNYLDDMLEQTIAGYKTLRSQYRRTLTQRNSLLKQSDAATPKQLFPWNLRLSQLAGQIVRARVRLAGQLQGRLPELYQQIAQTDTRVALGYDHRWPADSYESHMLQKLEADLQLDRLRGFTATGPHREDFTIFFEDRPANETASRGELRTAVLALKIIELSIIEAIRGVPPILLLDDVFSELDGKRRHALTRYLTQYQTFITTTDADVVLQHFTDNCNIIALGN